MLDLVGQQPRHHVRSWAAGARSGPAELWHRRHWPAASAAGCSGRSWRMTARSAMTIQSCGTYRLLISGGKSESSSWASAAASDPTFWRTLSEIGPTQHDRIARARAKTRQHVWKLIDERHGRIPPSWVGDKKQAAPARCAGHRGRGRRYLRAGRKPHRARHRRGAPGALLGRVRPRRAGSSRPPGTVPTRGDHWAPDAGLHPQARSEQRRRSRPTPERSPPPRE